MLWLIFLLAALCEVGGDAAIRFGLLRGGPLYVLAGMMALAAYGLVVNTPKWLDFSKLMGVYIAVFALVSILAARFVFRETIPSPTWLGLALIITGGLIIQFGR